MRVGSIDLLFLMSEFSSPSELFVRSDGQGTADPCDQYKRQLPTRKRSSNITRLV